MVGSGETQRRGERQIQDHRGRVESEPQRETERRGMEGSLQTLKGQSIFTYSPPPQKKPSLFSCICFLDKLRAFFPGLFSVPVRGASPLAFFLMPRY